MKCRHRGCESFARSPLFIACDPHWELIPHPLRFEIVGDATSTSPSRVARAHGLAEGAWAQLEQTEAAMRGARALQRALQEASIAIEVEEIEEVEEVKTFEGPERKTRLPRECGECGWSVDRWLRDGRPHCPRCGSESLDE